MMRQSINFLTALPKRSQRLSAEMIGALALVALLLFVVVSIVLGIQQRRVHHQLTDVKNEWLVTQRAYDQLAKKYPLLVSDTPLMNRVKALDQRVIEKEAELKSLQALLFRRGFSEYMDGLADAVPNTVWIKQIQIHYNPVSVTLTGYSVQPRAVSDLLSRLMKMPAYSEVVFNVFYVKTLKDHPYFKFSVATHVLGMEEEPEEAQKNQSPITPKE